MAMTLSELRELVDRDRLTYFVDPTQPRLVVPMTGLFGAYQFLVMLEVDGFRWSRPLALYSRRNATLSAGAAAFIDVLHRAAARG